MGEMAGGGLMLVVETVSMGCKGDGSANSLDFLLTACLHTRGGQVLECTCCQRSQDLK